MAHGAWLLPRRRYDTDPAKLQLIIRTLYAALRARGLHVDGLPEGTIETFPLYEVKRHTSALQRAAVRSGAHGGALLGPPFGLLQLA